MNTSHGHEQRLAAIGVLAGGIAHDFNNILTAILGYGERALNEAARGSRLRRDLEGILAAGERGRSLIEQVLTIGSDTTGESSAVNVGAEISDALDLLQARLPAGITIETFVESGELPVRASSNDVHRLLMNLATNALQAMPEGGTLGVSVVTQDVVTPRTMTMGALVPGVYVVLRVSDTGAGIAPATLDRIFDRFFTTRKSEGGTGFGLSLVRAIATDAGGAIDVQSRVGAGSRFAVYLPRADVVASA